MPLGTAIVSRLVVKGTGRSTSFSAYSAAGSFVLAAAKTSGCAPERIWAASSSEPAKLARTVAGSNSSPYAVNALFSDAAAETMSVGFASSSPPQPASARTAATARTATHLIGARP